MTRSIVEHYIDKSIQRMGRVSSTVAINAKCPVLLVK